jgi:hypothetical protein
MYPETKVYPSPLLENSEEDMLFKIPEKSFVEKNTFIV